MYSSLCFLNKTNIYTHTYIFTLVNMCRVSINLDNTGNRIMGFLIVSSLHIGDSDRIKETYLFNFKLQLKICQFLFSRFLASYFFSFSLCPIALFTTFFKIKIFFFRVCRTEVTSSSVSFYQNKDGSLPVSFPF